MTGETRPEEVGLSAPKLRRAFRLLDEWVESGTVPGVAAVVRRGGVRVAAHYAGAARWTGGSRAVDCETLFLLASVSKPYTAAAAMLLVEDGRLALDDRLVDILPEWRESRGQIDRVRVWHLLTHTSGLTDIPATNTALRVTQPPLAAFVEAGRQAGLKAEPGQGLEYCSMGFLLLGEIIHRVAGSPLPEFLDQRVFGPAGLRSTFLGAPEAVVDRIAEQRLWEGELVGHMGDRPAAWDYNSQWFRQLASPWAGVYASAEDVAGFGQLFLDALAGRHLPTEDRPIFSRATVELMTRIHTEGIPGNFYGAGEHWGLGWIIGGRGRPFFFGDLASPETFGHIGYTGTTLWVDPRHELVCAVLTNTVTEWRTDFRRFDESRPVLGAAAGDRASRKRVDLSGRAHTRSIAGGADLPLRA